MTLNLRKPVRTLDSLERYVTEFLDVEIVATQPIERAPLVKEGGEVQ